MEIKPEVTSEVSKNAVSENKSFNPDKRIDVSQKSEITKDTGYNVDKRIEMPENRQEVNGGSYAEVKKYSNGETHEVHHMPADSVSNIDREKGPAIKMEKADHRQTASYGNSKEAQEYRAAQKELIANGDFQKAFEMDIKDITSKFGDKYSAALVEVGAYVFSEAFLSIANKCIDKYIKQYVGATQRGGIIE